MRKSRRLKILICGDRDWHDQYLIARRIHELCVKFDLTVVHGDCRGADRIAGSRAEAFGCKVKAYPAEWDKYGRAAGPIRNKQMLVEEDPELVIGFHEDIRKSKGTRDMLRIAFKAGKFVELIDRNGRVFLKRKE
jgi:hypothetical protein